MEEFNKCYLTKQGSLAELVQECKVIIGDEAQIMTEEIIELFDIL